MVQKDFSWDITNFPWYLNSSCIIINQFHLNSTLVHWIILSFVHFCFISPSRALISWIFIKTCILFLHFIIKTWILINHFQPRPRSKISFTGNFSAGQGTYQPISRKNHRPFVWAIFGQRAPKRAKLVHFWTGFRAWPSNTHTCLAHALESFVHT